MLVCLDSLRLSSPNYVKNISSTYLLYSLTFSFTSVLGPGLAADLLLMWISWVYILLLSLYIVHSYHLSHLLSAAFPALLSPSHLKHHR